MQAVDWEAAEDSKAKRSASFVAQSKQASPSGLEGELLSHTTVAQGRASEVLQFGELSKMSRGRCGAETSLYNHCLLLLSMDRPRFI